MGKSQRLKVKVLKLQDLDGVDRALCEIGKLQILTEKLEGDAQIEINKIKTRVVDESAKLRARIADLTEHVAAFAEYKREELFKKQKTMKIVFGIFGFRQSTKIKTKKTTVLLLKTLGLAKYIRIKEEPNKEAMAELDDKTLLSVGAKRDVKDEFFLEPDREKIADSPVAAGM